MELLAKDRMVTAALPETLLEQINNLARKQLRTRSFIVRQALEQYLKAHNNENAG